MALFTCDVTLKNSTKKIWIKKKNLKNIKNKVKKKFQYWTKKKIYWKQNWKNWKKKKLKKIWKKK